MHGKAINLDHLEIVLGRPPRRYAKGDLRNTRRARWIQRAAIATAALLARNDARGERQAKERAVRTNVISRSNPVAGHPPFCGCVRCTPPAVRGLL